MWLFVDIFFHVHPVGVGADLSCPYPRTPTKWRCIGAIWQYNIYLFLGIAHLFISY